MWVSSIEDKCVRITAWSLDKKEVCGSEKWGLSMSLIKKLMRINVFHVWTMELTISQRNIDKNICTDLLEFMVE